ncbi:MAG: tetratricopeptide repeat protein [bacterium]|nr:tetratricopeptide repeat protein [bacterium]
MRRETLAAALVAALCLAGCKLEPASLPADLEEVSHPALESIEEIARRQLEDQLAVLGDRLRKGAEPRELADAFGGMGELYHAYDLLPAAAACYRNAQKIDPASFLWPYYLGSLHQSSGDLENATASLTQALEKRVDDLPALRRLGEVLLALGDAEGSRERFTTLLDDEQFAAAGHFGLGRAAAANEDWEGAVEHLEAALELQPEAAIVHHPLGLALRHLDRPDEGRAHLEHKGSGEIRSPDRLMERLEALAISSGAHVRRGNQALVNGRLDEAAAAFRRAVEANPESSPARRNLALVLARQGHFDTAIEALEPAAEADPGNVWVHFDLGNLYRSKGQREQAVASFRRAVEIDPEMVEGHFNLANTLIDLDLWGEAREHLAQVLRLDAYDRRARYLSAMASHHDGQTPAAIKELRRLLREDPTDTVARRGLATVLVAAGRWQRALEVYREGVDLDLPVEQKIELLEPLARLSWQRGQRQQAVAYFQQAVELDPESSQAHTNLANTLQLIGQRTEARRLFGRATELDPGNATAWLSEASLWILEQDFAEASKRLEAGLHQAPEDIGLNHTLARLLATCPDDSIRDGRRALALARKAYGYEASLDHAETIGMALAEIGEFEEAIRFQRGLLNQAALRGDRAVIQRLMVSLKLYEKRQPVRVSGQ